MTHVEVGSSLLIVGFPLGFHDTLHHMPVVRQAVNASSFGLRFQGKGYFLTDARTHRGTSGAPVVLRAANGPAAKVICPGHCSACIRRDSTPERATWKSTRRLASIAPGTRIFC